MRFLPLLVTLAAAGCLWQGDAPAPEPEPVRQWHMSSDVVFEEGFCGDCHYGLTEFWLGTWQRDGDWNLTIGPRFAEAPLVAVQVSDEPVIEATPWQAADVVLGDTHTVTFDVAGADHVLFKAFGSDQPEAALSATYNRQDNVTTALRLIDPTGDVHEAEGPEQDLRIAIVPAVEGIWTAEITFVDGPPKGQVWWRHELLRGDVWTGGATAAFAANATGAPPATTVRIIPHHDHASFQNTEWDPYDSTAFTVTYTPTPGPPPPPAVWNQTAIDGLWDGDEYLFHSFAGTMQGAYLDRPGHNDPGFGGSYPHFAAPDGDPVLPGTGHIRLELTWEPAIEAPLGVKMSPTNWPYFLYPEATVREPGRAVFEVRIAPMWWEEPDQTLEWYEPGVVRSYYDIAPYMPEDGGVHATAFDYELRAFAVRG